MSLELHRSVCVWSHRSGMKPQMQKNLFTYFRPSELHASLTTSSSLIHEFLNKGFVFGRIYMFNKDSSQSFGIFLDMFEKSCLTADSPRLLLCTMSSCYVFIFLICFVCDTEKDFFPQNFLELSVLIKLS